MQVRERVVILANGRFPEADLPLGYLDTAEKIICCDGAVDRLVEYGLEPYAIVGDMDSISQELKTNYSDIISGDAEDQDTNDLTKAVRYCISEGIENVVILGATGLREDHTLGNISLLLEYADFLNVKLVSDYGVFLCLRSATEISSFPGQQVSIFSNKPESRISSTNLKYPLDNNLLDNWWMGTLNECTSHYFSLTFDSEFILVFMEF
ncbi:MAG: thiamine diphosphokinase [Bacteroidales bacterium]|nr:thiamine diphosphokinase [Bacteroidales bacterium]